MRLQIKWRNGWAYASGFKPDGKRLRRALKTKDARRAEELRADLENKIWRGNLYGADVVTTFDQAAVHYAEDGGETRFLVKISEQLAGVALKSITPQIIRNAAKCIGDLKINWGIKKPIISKKDKNALTFKAFSKII